MSALGHMRTLSSVRVMSVLHAKADIRQRELYVRYVPQADTGKNIPEENELSRSEGVNAKLGAYHFLRGPLR